MIKADFRNGDGLHIEGDISDVSAEAILILRELYKRNVETYGETVARGLLTNMVVKAVFEDAKREDVPITWSVSEAQVDARYD